MENANITSLFCVTERSNFKSLKYLSIILSILIIVLLNAFLRDIGLEYKYIDIYRINEIHQFDVINYQQKRTVREC